MKAVLEEFYQSNKTEYAERYIRNNFDKLKSPYTGKPLHIEDIEKIICCHTSSTLKAGDDQALRKLCSSHASRVDNIRLLILDVIIVPHMVYI